MLELSHRFISSQNYHAMLSTGIVREDERLELIEGMLVEMSPPSSEHAAVVRMLVQLLTPLLDASMMLDVQNPLWLEDGSEPQPDVMLLKARADFYLRAHPRAEDVLLLIEVAKSSLSYDRSLKAQLYARTGVAEYWLVDIENRQLIVHQHVAQQGDARGYQQVHSYREGVLTLSNGQVFDVAGFLALLGDA